MTYIAEDEGGPAMYWGACYHTRKTYRDTHVRGDVEYSDDIEYSDNAVWGKVTISLYQEKHTETNTSEGDREYSDNAACGKVFECVAVY